MGPWMMGSDGFGGYSPWWGVVTMAFWVLVIVGEVLLIVWMVRQLQGGSMPRAGGDDRALSILRERFARGEITQEQFDEMRRTLE